MIRWYDYILAIMVADLTQTFLFAGFNATTWWQPLIYGFIAGMIWKAWDNEYCNFRKRRENGK